MIPPAKADTRTRILLGALRSVERLGMARTSLEDVAQTAGLSRATIYRYFPGGRDEVVSETVNWEVQNFLTRIVDAVAGLDGVEAKLVEALLVGHRAIGDHLLLQQLLSTEPEEIVRELAEAGPVMRVAISAYIADELRLEDLRSGTDVAEAADYCARLYLSYLGSHGGSDLADRADVTHLVATQFLAGIVDPGLDLRPPPAAATS
jgi:AcrR family transcriptional regulator